MPKISIFPEGYVSKKTGKLSPATNPHETLEFESYIERVRDGYWQDYVLPIRAGKMEKLKAPGVTASGIFSYRNVKGMVEHSGILAVDIDAKDNEQGIDFDVLGADKYTYALHRSIGGSGAVVYVKINPDKHKESYLGLIRYYRNNYKLEIDPAPSNPASYRFVSFDPDAVLIKGAKIFKEYLPKQKVKPQSNYVFAQDDISFIMHQIRDRSINLCEEYNDWINVAMAFANHYGEAGRDHFHFISSYSAKYDRDFTDKTYSGALKRKRGENGIGSFFHLCQIHGITIKTPKTETIERVAKMRRKDSNLKDPKEDALKTLELQGIKKEEAELIVDQVMNLPERDVKEEKSNDLIEDLKAFLSGYKLEFNDVTRQIEVDGENINDRILNSIYIRSKGIVHKDITKDLLKSLIDSDFTPTYNPFQRFFNTNRHLKPEGLIKELLSCIEYEANLSDGSEEFHVSNYLENYMQKWLLSVVASMHGTYSVMCLVLTGGQGESKTKFFRELLPDELLPYYGESKLDGGNDDYMLMCKKIMILDDEFGGKSKQEAKKFKELSSKETFNLRRPYGTFHEDLKRLAVLCGTSNDEEIINDPTGNRRIIPVNVISIDWDKYNAIDKTALWMELYWKYKEVGNNWMLTKEDIKYLEEINRKNEQPSVEYESIIQYFRHPKEEYEAKYMTNTEIINYIEMRSKLKINTYKMGVNLKKLGFKKMQKRLDRFNNSPRLVYRMAFVVEDLTTQGNVSDWDSDN